jgi:hypothetical protein
MNTLRFLIGITALWIGAARAGDVPEAPSAAAWRAAAKGALAVMAPDPDEILVLDPSLSAQAGDTLKELRKTIGPDELPDREHYVLPPGPYLQVRTFEPHGDRFEFRATGGVIPRNAYLNCGQTEHFFLARDKQGAWKVDGMMEVSMC